MKYPAPCRICYEREVLQLLPLSSSSLQAFKDFLFKQSHAVQISNAEVASLVQAIVPSNALQAELRYNESIAQSKIQSVFTSDDWTPPKLDRKKLVQKLYSAFGLVDSPRMAGKIVDVGDALNLNSESFGGPKHVQMSMATGQVVVLCGVGKTTALAILQLAVHFEMSVDPKTIKLRNLLLANDGPRMRAETLEFEQERKKTGEFSLLAEHSLESIALQSIKKPERLLRVVRCNPSSLLVEDMLGHHSHATGEWVDGFITRLVRAETRRNEYRVVAYKTDTEQMVDKVVERLKKQSPEQKAETDSTPKQRTIVVLDTLCDGAELAACHSQLISSLEGTRGEDRTLHLPNCSTLPVPKTLGFAFETRDLSVCCCLPMHYIFSTWNYV